MNTYSFTRNDFEKYASKETFEKIVNLKTIPEFLSYLKKNYESLPSIGKNDGTVATFDDLLSDINNISSFLVKNNIKKGDNVGVLFENSYQFAAVSLGIMAMGAVAVLIPIQLDQNVVFGFSKKYVLKGIIYNSLLNEKVSLLNQNDLLVANFDDATKEKSSSCYISGEICENDPACIIMTGGTTGKSKGAILSHTALMCGMINGCYGIDGIFNQVYYCIMPLTHVFGFIRNLLTSLYTGSCIYFNTDKKLMFGEMQKTKPTVLVIVPALAELFLNLMKAYGKDFLGGNIKMVICGAANVPPYLTTEYTKIGIQFCAGYGLTEFANMVSGNPDASNPETVGMLFPDQEAKTVNGELWLKGRNMMLGYFNEPEENKNAFEDGWFKTGDLARFDEKNNLYIIGRIKDVIVLSNGENVSPAYIENKIDELDYIQDCLVTEAKNEFGAEVLQVEVLLRQPVVKALGIKEEEIQSFVENGINSVNEKLLDYERVSKIVIRDKDFDRTPAMKIIRPKKVY